jgi:hypothetical protein
LFCFDKDRKIVFYFVVQIVRNADSARLTEEMGTNCVCHPERKKERQREEKGEKMEREGEEEKYVLVYV